MSDIESIEARHVPYAADPTIMRTDDDPAWCAECDIPAPCDTIEVLARLREVEVERQRERAVIEAAKALHWIVYDDRATAVQISVKQSAVVAAVDALLEADR